jgi:predicted RNase H-like HicB family nuclease
MKVKVRIYQAGEGGYWAKVPGMPGCVTEGETLEEVKKNIAEAMEGILAEEGEPDSDEPSQVVELEV